MQLLEFSSFPEIPTFDTSIPIHRLYTLSIMPNRSTNATTPARKRKRRDLNSPETGPTINKDELVAYAEAHFPTSLAALRPASSMLFLRQTRDLKGGPVRLLVGKMKRDGMSLSIFTYLRGPSWVIYTAGGPRVDRSTLSADSSVVLEEPFNLLGTTRQAGDMGALVVYYHIVRGHWKEFETDPEALVNLGVFKMACKRVRDEKKVIEENASEERVDFAAAWRTNLEGDVSSEVDSEDDSLFVKDCEQCRKIKREESHCRNAGHPKILAAMQKENRQLKEQLEKDVAYMKRQRNLVMQEANTLEREVREKNTVVDEVERWSNIAEKAMREQDITRRILFEKNITDAKMAKWRRELGIPDDGE